MTIFYGAENLGVELAVADMQLVFIDAVLLQFLVQFHSCSPTLEDF